MGPPSAPARALSASASQTTSMVHPADRPDPNGASGSLPGKPLVASARARARVGTVTTMAATATPEPPTGVSLIELAIGAGYAFRDQLWRTRAACAGVDPEVFLTERGASPEPALAYCRRCEVRTECLEAALDLGQRSVGIWGGVSGKQRRIARQQGWDATRLLVAIEQDRHHVRRAPADA